MIRTIITQWDLLKRQPLLKPECIRHKAKVRAFIQARLGSKRFPGKIYKQLNGAPILFHVVNAAKQAKTVNGVVIISPQPLQEIPAGIPNFIFDQDEDDVLSRFCAALDTYPCDYVVRLTADCPLLDPHLIDFVIAMTIKHKADYGSNVLVQTFPDGMDVEVISADTLRKINKWTESGLAREHVTTILRNDPNIQLELSLLSIQAMQDHSYIKLSVDTEDDLHRVSDFERRLACQVAGR